MLKITQKDYARALGVHKNTVTARLAEIPFNGRPRRYALAKILPTVKWRESKGLQALFDASKRADEDDLFVGDDAAKVALALADWLDPVQKSRAYHTQKQFCSALADAMSSSVLFGDIERLRLAILLSDQTLPYIALGDDTTFPNWKQFAPRFAISNARTPTQETRPREEMYV